MMKFKAVFFPVLLAAALLPVTTHAEEPARYALTIGLEDDGDRIANPRLEVLGGATATLEVGDERAKTYHFVGTVTPTQAGKVKVAFRYTIADHAAAGAPTSRAVESSVEVDYGSRVVLQFDKDASGNADMALSLQVDVVQ